MPETEVVFYRDSDGTVPALAWLDSIDRRARAKSIAAIERLRAKGTNSDALSRIC